MRLRTPWPAAIWCLAVLLQADTSTWIQSAGGDWASAANWLPGGVPGPGDTAVVDLPGTYTVDVSGSVSVGTVRLVGGSGAEPTLRVLGNLTAGILETGVGAALVQHGNVSVGERSSISGTYVWNSGFIQGGGSTRVEAGGVLRIDSGSTHEFPAHTVTNRGTVEWTGGLVRGGQGSVLVNLGEWRVNGGGDVNSDYGGGVSVRNDGLWRLESAGHRRLVPVSGGGRFEAVAGVGLPLFAGADFDAGARLGGEGEVQLVDGTFTFGGSVQAS